MLYKWKPTINEWDKYLIHTNTALNKLADSHQIDPTNVHTIITMNTLQKASNSFISKQRLADEYKVTYNAIHYRFISLLDKGYIERVNEVEGGFYNVTAKGINLCTGFTRIMTDLTNISGSHDKRAKHVKRNYGKEFDKYFSKSKHGKKGFQGIRKDNTK